MLYACSAGPWTLAFIGRVIALNVFDFQVVNVLKSRNQSTRDEAAATLTEILKIAGVTLLPMVLETLNSILCSGFQVHVLGSVVHGLVRGTLVQIHEQSEEHSGTDGGSSKAAPADQKKVSKGKRVAARYLAGMKADDDTVWRCLPVLVAVVLEDVFGDTAAQKEDDSGYRFVPFQVTLVACVCARACVCCNMVHSQHQND